MAENYMSLNQEETNDFVNSTNKSSTAAGQTCEGMDSQFSAATDSGVMSDTVSSIRGQMQGISESIGNIGKMIQNHSNEMFDYDSEMAKLADEIEIPTDFLAENCVEVNQYNRTILGKIDGKSVNEGEAAKEFEEIDDSVVAAEQLIDITGQASKEEVYDDESTIEGQSILGNITKDETQKQEYDDTSSVKQSALEDISKEATEQQEYSDESSIQGKSILGNINNNSSTQEQQYDANLSIAAAQTLGTMNDNSANQDDLDQRVMAAAFDNYAASQYEEERKKKKAEDELEHVDYDEFENTN